MIVRFEGAYRDPPDGEYITYEAPGKPRVPKKPIIGFVEGDGVGPEVANAALRVAEAAVEAAYGGSREVVWYEVVLGEKAEKYFGTRMPSQSIEVLSRVRVFFKAPLETPVGTGWRSVNVALRQMFDLYANIRPVKYFEGLPSPLKDPRGIDLIIFRENTEDVYSGIEWEAFSEGARKVREFLKREFGIEIREDAGIGLKPISMHGTKRLARLALRFAVENRRRVVTVMHKGNIMKYTEGAFRNWVFEVAREEFGEYVVFESELGGQPPPPGKILVNDRIADNMLQQIILRPRDYDVVITPNLNGDYLSDAAAALVGGLGVAPALDYGDWGMMAEPVHGTAPKYRGKNYVNPTAAILSIALLFRFLGWVEAADLIERAVARTYADGVYTGDLARQLGVDRYVGTSEFADAVIERLKA